MTYFLILGIQHFFAPLGAVMDHHSLTRLLGFLLHLLLLFARELLVQACHIWPQSDGEPSLLAKIHQINIYYIIS